MPESRRDAYKDDSTLRDELAKERTQLAKERTLLAYVRTALAFLAVGAGFMQFFEAMEFSLQPGYLSPPASVSFCSEW